MRRIAILAAALPLLAQSQSTFYEAYEDGRDLESKGNWQGALSAYQRAAFLHPASAARVLTYGNNLLEGYYPYTRMARCLLELGQPAAAQAQLARARAMHEPLKDREALEERLQEKPPVQDAPPAVPDVKPEAATPAARPIHPPPDATSEPIPAPPQESPAATPRLPHAAAAPRSPSPAPADQEPLPAQPAANPPAHPAPQPAPASETDGASSARWWLLALLLLPAAYLLRKRRPKAREAGFEEPSQIGPYRIERLLGRGGFASTYLARHAVTGKEVAVKRLHPYRLDDPEFVGRFRQEARLGAELKHPNLVALEDPGPSDGPPWIAMEFVEGETLAERLKSGGQMALPEMLRIARDLASAIAYAHGMGVIHRDLKPANIVLAKPGAKIMDFGIARVMDAETLTTTYAFLGTPRYAAPEAQTKTTLTPASDWYAFGIILFELLTGTPPFQGETPFEILDLHRNQALPDPRPLRPDAPAELVQLIQALCAKNPGDRPAGSEVLARLEALA